jgi:hypothetical protein
MAIAATSQIPMHATSEIRNGRLPAMRDAPVSFYKSRRGQSLIETCLAMGIICFVFFGLFQLSQLAAAREILNHAAARGARAKTVGFNRFMVEKAIRVAAIPNAGRIVQPAFTNEDLELRRMIQTQRPGELWDNVLSNTVPASLQQDLERARIPEYMGSASRDGASFILDYEDWDSIGWSFPSLIPDATLLNVHVSQSYPLRIPLHRIFYAADSVDLDGYAGIESHYPLYLDDGDL